MAENVYLTKKREEYEGLRSAIEGLQTRAAEASRGLTEDELRQISEMKATGDALFSEIETLTDVELRSAKVRAMQAQIAGLTGGPAPDDGTTLGGDQHRSAGGAKTKPRDPGHYRSLKEGGSRSFFGDIYLARDKGDAEAARRLTEHDTHLRADGLTTGSAGAGIVPPKWLVEEYLGLARQGRALADAVRNIPLGDDPRPMTLPKQTAGTDSEVVEQAAENDAIEDDDVWASSVDTVTPKPTAGSQVVSRQMLDMSNPAIDMLIYGDLLAAYNLKVEKKVGAAVIAVGTALAGLEGAGVEIGDPEHYTRVLVKAALAVRNARKAPANLATMSVNRWGILTDERDTTGRPLVTGIGDPGVNTLGGTVDLSSTEGGRYRGLRLIPTDGILLDDRIAAVRSNDVLLFESNVMRFRYEQPLGPQSIKMGIWAYTAVLVRAGTGAIKRVEITEES